MQIKIYYEDKCHPINLEVPNNECEIWIETDYQKRLAEAKDKSAVTRRSAQEIMDEDFNKPTFNNNQTETRRHISLEALNLDDNLIAGKDDVESVVCREDYSQLRHAISMLKPKQRDLIKKIFWDDVKQVEIAKEQGVSEAAIAQRMAVIYARLKKILTK